MCFSSAAMKIHMFCIMLKCGMNYSHNQSIQGKGWYTFWKEESLEYFPANFVRSIMQPGVDLNRNVQNLEIHFDGDLALGRWLLLFWRCLIVWVYATDKEIIHSLFILSINIQAKFEYAEDQGLFKIFMEPEGYTISHMACRVR